MNKLNIDSKQATLDNCMQIYTKQYKLKIIVYAVKESKYYLDNIGRNLMI